MIDCSNRTLYELYNVWYDASKSQWHAGSGVFFDLARNDRRPDGWTSADAAGLAIFPGLVRYEEATNPLNPVAPARSPAMRPAAVRTQVILRRLGLKPPLQP